jgi:hypothetical protein
LEPPSSPWTAGKLGSGARAAYQWGLQSSTSAGYIYAFDGDWNNGAQANSASTTYDKLLAVSTGSSTKTMILEGIVVLATLGGTSPADGDPIYLSDVDPARATVDPPTGSGEYVRLLGYVIDATNKIVYFSPDKTWIKLT